MVACDLVAYCNHTTARFCPMIFDSGIADAAGDLCGVLLSMEKCCKIH